MERTPLDMHIRLFGIHLIVLPFFWLYCLVIGYQVLTIDPLLFVVLVGCIFLSLLVHELGHGLAFRYFGCYEVTIVLREFGGYATGDPPLRNRRHRIISLLAGPGAGFLLAALVYGSNEATGWAFESPHSLATYVLLMQCNIIWGLVNLPPVYPLDGGQIARELFVKFDPWAGVRKSLQLSIGVAILVVILSLNRQFGFLPELQRLTWWWPVGLVCALFFGIMAMNNYQELQNHRDYGGYDDRAPWQR